MPGGPYPPPEVVASWPKPNYVNPQTRGPGLTIASSIMTAIGVIVVATRLYARLVITKAPGLDDAIIAVALLLAIGSSILTIYGTEALFIGYHVWDIPVSAYAPMRLNSWCAQWLYTGALCAVKISLLLFYRRLSVTFSSLFLWATWIGISYNILYFLSVAFSITFECRPTNAYWLEADPTWLAQGHSYHCAHIEGIILPLYSALSVVGDAYSTTLPLCLVYSLKIGRRQKMSLYCLFALGYLVVGAGIVRTIFVNQVLNETYDTSWRYYDSMIWVTVELYFAITCASAPGLKPFVQRFFVEPMTQDSSSRNKRRSGYTIGSSGKRYGYAENPSDTYLNDTHNNEESWAREGAAVELSRFGRKTKDEKIGVTVHETGEYFNDAPRHSLISNRLRTVLEPYPGPQQDPYKQLEHQQQRTASQATSHNTADRHSHNSEEAILEPPQILNKRVAPHPGELVPFRFMPSPAPEDSSTPRTRGSSFVTISAFPVPQARAPSRISETDERAMDGSESLFDLPLQGTRENSPVDMKPMRSTRQHIALQHVREKSKVS